MDKYPGAVALLAEGVDRNYLLHPAGATALPVALLAEGVDRNAIIDVEKREVIKSPSSRRAWIEMSHRWRPT